MQAKPAKPARTQIKSWSCSKAYFVLKYFYNFINSFPWLGPPLSLLSCLGEPRLSFLIIFPLLVSVRREVGVRYLASLMVSQWLGMVLKWLIQGDRPYWWSHTTQTFTYETEILQTGETCQTGPGCPSSHCQTWAVTSYVVFDLFQRKPSSSSTFWCLQVMMGLSRSFIGAHFPHQCVLGTAAGIGSVNY